MFRLSALEIKAIKMLLAGENQILDVLRNQFEYLILISRELTGVGFYLNFTFDETVKKIDFTGKFSIGDVCGRHPRLDHGAGFILFINNGLIDFLESYTFDEGWPSDESNFELFYSDIDHELRCYLGEFKRPITVIENDKNYKFP